MNVDTEELRYLTKLAWLENMIPALSSNPAAKFIVEKAVRKSVKKVVATSSDEHKAHTKSLDDQLARNDAALHALGDQYHFPQALPTATHEVPHLGTALQTQGAQHSAEEAHKLAIREALLEYAAQEHEAFTTHAYGSNAYETSQDALTDSLPLAHGKLATVSDTAGGLGWGLGIGALGTLKVLAPKTKKALKSVAVQSTLGGIGLGLGIAGAYSLGEYTAENTHNKLASEILAKIAYTRWKKELPGMSDAGQDRMAGEFLAPRLREQNTKIMEKHSIGTIPAAARDEFLKSRGSTPAQLKSYATEYLADPLGKMVGDGKPAIQAGNYGPYTKALGFDVTGTSHEKLLHEVLVRHELDEVRHGVRLYNSGEAKIHPRLTPAERVATKLIGSDTRIPKAIREGFREASYDSPLAARFGSHLSPRVVLDESNIISNTTRPVQQVMKHLRSTLTNEGPRLEGMIGGFKYGEPIGHHTAHALESAYIAQDLGLHPETQVQDLRKHFASLPKPTQIVGVAAVNIKDTINSVLSKAKGFIRR